MTAAHSIRLFDAVIRFCHDFFQGAGGRIIPVKFPFSALEQRVIHIPIFGRGKRRFGDRPCDYKAGAACRVNFPDLTGKFQIGDLSRFQINPRAAVTARIHVVLEIIGGVFISIFRTLFRPQRNGLCGAALLGHLVQRVARKQADLSLPGQDLYAALARTGPEIQTGALPICQVDRQQLELQFARIVPEMYGVEDLIRRRLIVLDPPQMPHRESCALFRRGGFAGCLHCNRFRRRSRRGGRRAGRQSQAQGQQNKQ